MDEDDDTGSILNRVMNELHVVKYHRENKSTHDVVISKESFHPGDEIYCSYPYAAVSVPRRSSQICSYCFKRTKLMRCSRCRNTKYCSRECQARDWQHHKVVCCLNNTDALTHLLLRIVLSLVGSETMTPLYCDGRNDIYRKQFELETFLDLQEVLNRDPNIAAVELYKKCPFQNTLQQLISEIAPRILEHSDTVLRERGFSDESLRRLQNGSPYSSKVTDYCLVRLLRKQCVNIVPIRNHILEIIGYGIYPTLSPIQHSCDPNCVVVFDELCAKLIAIRPICPNDLLTVSFISTRHAYPVRDEYLSRSLWMLRLRLSTWKSEEWKKKEKEAFAIKCPEVFNGISCSGLCFPIVSFPGTYPCMELKCLRL
ncbi:histone-lysine n-methyltransferase [Blastocystis sp. subtype 4]|uniref:histone-lysine n-methyltransferase n=1 Tax=Blastocystis sp. subtype 4 TaxID=944170 RepID=UPI000711CFBF|nr:histone-lysine n-methyltransferase [Blastocystis sp. subtype 4]KNB45633.1 histone-lysine n-methyltransferase [Blastocystis sp. subtype 4]|eukprot:XP_014529075.1 histone-lysine n-methyltransferase [Blastocystis sp. subtype 4]